MNSFSTAYIQPSATRIIDHSVHALLKQFSIKIKSVFELTLKRGLRSLIEILEHL